MGQAVMIEDEIFYYSDGTVIIRNYGNEISLEISDCDHVATRIETPEGMMNLIGELIEAYAFLVEHQEGGSRPVNHDEL